MRLRELKFPIAIQYPNELEGGRHCGLHNLARFNWSLAVAYQDGRFDNAEIIDSSGKAFGVEKVYFMRPTLWRFFIDRLGHFLILPRMDKREIVRVDMELKKTRQLTLDQFKDECRKLIASHPAWWKRYSSADEIERMFIDAHTFPDAINEIGTFAPSDNMIYRGKSAKIVDLR
jgi:hypothetical protein